MPPLLFRKKINLIYDEIRPDMYGAKLILYLYCQLVWATRMILFFSFIFGFLKHNEKRICGESALLIVLTTDEINMKTKRTNI